jgi:predicted negative regulator of RcsB-dependent stress response
VTELRTEEEQFEALKNWWQANNRSLAGGIVSFIIAIMGWNYWQNQQQDKMNQASNYYHSILTTLQSTDGQLDQENIVKVSQLATQLRNEYSNSPYAIYAALVMARLAVNQNELSLAHQQLQWILDQKTDAQLLSVTRIRMARVLTAMGKLDQALSVLDDAFDPKWESNRLQVKGDILLQQGDVAKARIAYENAQKMIDAIDMSAPLLHLKLNDSAR